MKQFTPMVLTEGRFRRAYVPEKEGGVKQSTPHPRYRFGAPGSDGTNVPGEGQRR